MASHDNFWVAVAAAAPVIALAQVLIVGRASRVPRLKLRWLSRVAVLTAFVVGIGVAACFDALYEALQALRGAGEPSMASAEWELLAAFGIDIAAALVIGAALTIRRASSSER